VWTVYCDSAVGSECFNTLLYVAMPAPEIYAFLKHSVCSLYLDSVLNTITLVEGVSKITSNLLLFGSPSAGVARVVTHFYTFAGFPNPGPSSCFKKG